jgi:ATP-dependent Clp protease ATP-binding subunit ClpC
MPKINVYLPDELAEAVKDLSIPVSVVCQHALQHAVRRMTAVRESARLDLDLGDALDRLTQFTARARTVIQLGVARARDAGADHVGTEHLLAGMIDEGSNMGLLVLRALEIEPGEVNRQLAAQPVDEPVGEPAGHPLDGPAARALELSATEAIALGHNYIGCEHLVLGLVAEPDGAAGRLLRSLGAEPRLARRAVATALSGWLHAQSTLQQAQPGGPGGPGALLQQALRPIGERLDRLENRLDTLTAHQPG